MLSKIQHKITKYPKQIFYWNEYTLFTHSLNLFVKVIFVDLLYRFIDNLWYLLGY